MIKQAQRSLKEAIKKHEKGENVDIKEVAIVPASYYCWGVIVGGVLIFVLVLYLFIKRLAKKRNS